ncbi:hypothetical protein PS910_02570 [Pseudomonas fluorescens]|nr:hypothetical protein PS910_02570 [Pseudomonas fluorescens]
MSSSVTAHDLGIDLKSGGEEALFSWLVASFLMGKRIRAATAVRAYQLIVERGGCNTPRKLAQRPHRELVRMLGEAGYARYDESTARRLHALSQALERDYQGSLRHMREVTASGEAFERRLLAFEGIGPKTAEIFMRDAAVVIG